MSVDIFEKRVEQMKRIGPKAFPNRTAVPEALKTLTPDALRQVVGDVNTAIDWINQYDGSDHGGKLNYLPKLKKAMNEAGISSLPSIDAIDQNRAVSSVLAGIKQSNWDFLDGRSEFSTQDIAVAYIEGISGKIIRASVPALGKVFVGSSLQEVMAMMAIEDNRVLPTVKVIKHWIYDTSENFRDELRTALKTKLNDA